MPRTPSHRAPAPPQHIPPIAPPPAPTLTTLASLLLARLCPPETHTHASHHQLTHTHAPGCTLAHSHSLPDPALTPAPPSTHHHPPPPLTTICPAPSLLVDPVHHPATKSTTRSLTQALSLPLSHHAYIYYHINCSLSPLKLSLRHKHPHMTLTHHHSRTHHPAGLDLSISLMHGCARSSSGYPHIPS